MPRIYPFVLVVIVYGLISSRCDGSIAPPFEKRVTANGFLVSKWKIWYKSLDVNHDKMLTMDDMEASMNKYSSLLEELDSKQIKQIKDNFHEWWIEYIFRNNPGEITEKQFVDALQEDNDVDKKAFKERMEQRFGIFYAIDINNDGFLSKKEFLIVFKAYGHENAALDTKLFKAYNPTDGKVPVSTIVDTWVDFICNDDPSKRNIVKDGFEGGV